MVTPNFVSGEGDEKIIMEIIFSKNSFEITKKK
jgi:hypothetical protein